MSEEKKELDTLVQEKIDTDTDFQSSLDGLEDTEKENAIIAKRQEVVKSIFEEESEKRIKAEEVAKNQEIRAKKAEAGLKAKKEDTTSKNGLSAKDVVALRDVHEDDVDYLLGEAQLRGKSIQELKKDPYMKIILKTRADERATAQATNTGTGRTKTSQLSDEQILADAETGKEVDPEQFAQAKMNIRLKEAKR